MTFPCYGHTPWPVAVAWAAVRDCSVRLARLLAHSTPSDCAIMRLGQSVEFREDGGVVEGVKDIVVTHVSVCNVYRWGRGVRE